MSIAPTNTATVDIYHPIYADELTAKWQQVIQDAEERCEHKLDKWDIRFTLSEFEVEEDSIFKTITITGKGFDIHWLQRQFLDVFKVSFHKEFPEYKFKLIEELK